jgi:hypothetical protein
MTSWQLDIPAGGIPRLTSMPSTRGRVTMTGRAWAALVGGRHPRLTRIRAAYRLRSQRSTR